MAQGFLSQSLRFNKKKKQKRNHKYEEKYNKKITAGKRRKQFPQEKSQDKKISLSVVACETEAFISGGLLCPVKGFLQELHQQHRFQ